MENDNVHNLFERKVSAREEAQSPLAVDFSEDKIGRMKQALDDKIFLLGEPYTDGHGMHADWAHFDFLMSVHGEKIASAPNNLIAHKMFWAYLWEYLAPALGSYEALSESYMSLLEDTDAMLTNHAELRLKVDTMEGWILTLPEGLRSQYENYFNREKNKIDDQIAEIKRKEKEGKCGKMRGEKE